MNQPVGRWSGRLLAVSAAISLAAGWVGWRSFGLKADWLAYYTAGKFLLLGKAYQLYDLIAVQAWQSQYIGPFVTGFLYLPAYSLFFLPLALIPAPLARFAWLLVGATCAGLAAWLSRRWSGLNFPISLLALTAFPPFVFSLVVGQVSPITLLVFSGVAGREILSKPGFLTGLLAGLALYKPQLLIPLLVYWLFRGRWQILAGAILTGLGLGLVSWIVTPTGSLAFLRTAVGYFQLAGEANRTGANASLFALWPGIWVLISLAVLVVLVILARRPARDEADPLVQAMLWLAPALISPYLATYDLLLLILPVSFLTFILKRDRLLQSLVGLLYLSALLAIPLQTVRPVIWAAVGLFAVCAWRFFWPNGRRSIGRK